MVVAPNVCNVGCCGSGAVVSVVIGHAATARCSLAVQPTMGFIGSTFTLTAPAPAHTAFTNSISPGRPAYRAKIALPHDRVASLCLSAALISFPHFLLRALLLKLYTSLYLVPHPSRQRIIHSPVRQRSPFTFGLPRHAPLDALLTPPPLLINFLYTTASPCKPTS